VESSTWRVARGCYAEWVTTVHWLASICLLALLVSTETVIADDASETSPILAFYEFEQPTPSGPDTFWVRETGGGEVALSSAFRFAGERSLHISEVPGNRDFAEFLAYFRECRDGVVFIQYYLLLTDPEQRFNFGLAGPRWFLSTDRHGHAVWLQTDDGVLRHRPHGGWQQLFAPRPFAWYFIDLVYRVEEGTYDLSIFEEGLEEPVIDLHGAQGMNGNRNSAVKYFSLIGDLEDAGRFDFFVDDLIIATDPAVRQKPFVAPGRRRFFVDMLAVGTPRTLSPQEQQDLFWYALRWLGELDTRADTADLDRLESAADEAFRAGALDLAEGIYERLQDWPDRRLRMLLKLADVRHQQGDVEAERSLRESIYGRLEYEESRVE